MHPSMHIASYHRLLESPCLRGYGPPVDGSISTDRSLASSNGEDVRNTGAPGRNWGGIRWELDKKHGFVWKQDTSAHLIFYHHCSLANGRLHLIFYHHCSLANGRFGSQVESIDLDDGFLWVSPSLAPKCQQFWNGNISRSLCSSKRIKRYGQMQKVWIFAGSLVSHFMRPWPNSWTNHMAHAHHIGWSPPNYD